MSRPVSPAVPHEQQTVPIDALSGTKCFDAVLAVRPCARSRHFCVHFLPRAKVPVPTMKFRKLANSSADIQSSASPVAEFDGGGVAPFLGNLSTGSKVQVTMPVDDSGLRLGLIVPKRHAKRSVTRNLVKRHVREIWRLRRSDLPAGDWVVRLTAVLDRKTWPSGASEALALVISAELAGLLTDALPRADRLQAAARSAADSASTAALAMGTGVAAPHTAASDKP